MSDTERAQSLANVLEFNDQILMLGLTDMTDVLARRQLRTGGPSIAWNMGHMMQLRNEIAKAIGCRAPGIDLEPYKTGADTGASYPTTETLRAQWNEFSRRFITAIKQLDAATLAGPTPIQLPHGERTLLDALRLIVWHEGLHLGQIAMLRSHHGLTPLATLATEGAVVS